MKNLISFVVPVLDYSPASQYNINTLLDDLNKIKGELIVVFNNTEVANKISNHPRIDQYAILKNNVGVSRAWNIGLNISRTPYTFVLNADLKLEEGAVNTLLQNIMMLDKAAIVGPQGAFFNFETMTDFYFFKKGSFNSPIKVDAVSGFLFIVNNQLFNKHGISFDNRYTPCYREEWDVGLQVKRAGLACYIVPVNGYDHEWSGSIRSYRKIRYYDNEETPADILERTGRDFVEKWNEIAKTQCAGFLESGWKKFALTNIESSLKSSRLDLAQTISNLLYSQLPNDKEVLASMGLVAYYDDNWKKAKDYFKKALLLDPSYEVALKNIELISSRHESK